MQKISAKIGLSAALLGGSVALVTAVAADLSLVYPLMTAAILGLGMHYAADRLVTTRLRRVDAAISALRDEAGRTDPSGDPAGDEIDRLARKGDQAAHAVKKRIDELSRAESYRREYVGDVSHEIKTPIFAIQGFAETLLSGALDDPAVNRGFIRKILSHAARLSGLATDLAEISRLEAGTFKLQRTAVDVVRIFEEVRDSLDHALRDKKILLEIDVEAAGAWVDGDRDRIRQVITNLADNAVKYNNAGGRVRLHAHRDRSLVRLSVSDDGIGIATEDLPRITERFFRAERSRSRSQGGSGLGLSIVKHILGAHGAVLDVESTLAAGSTFSFALPAAEPVGGRARRLTMP